MYDKAIINGLVWMDKQFIKTNIYINDNRIKKISDHQYEANDTLDVHGDLIMPGLIDPHVHFDLDLGFIRSKDDFLTGSRQAAFGGVSVFIDFLDPVDNPDDLEKAYKKRLAEVQSSFVDYFFHATIKNPQCDLEDFVKKMKSLGINSLKCFTTYSDSNRRTYDADIIELLKLSEIYDFLLLVHIENDDIITLNKSFTYQDLLISRPSVSETSEALKLAGYVKEHGGHLYMVHLSSGDTLVKLKRQYGDILNKQFFIESCPHYFVFTNDDLFLDNGYLYTLAPPLRTRKEQEILKNNVDSIYAIGTDHCAFNKADKMNLPLINIPLGIGGVEFSFDMMYALYGEKVIDKMSSNISKLYPSLKHYGKIEEGYMANIIVYHLDNNKIEQSHGATDYNLYQLKNRKGYVKHHLIRGEWVLKNKVLNKPKGRVIRYDSLH